MRPPHRARARSGREAAVGVAFEMLLGIALLSLAAGPSAAAAKPSKPAKQPKQLPDVVKARIKLIDLYCNTDPKESVLINTSPTEKATAAKRVPCQARPRDTLTMTAPNILPHALTQLSSHACWSLSLALALILALAVSSPPTHPHQLLAYRKTLEVTGAEKKKVMEAKSRSFTPAQMRIDRRAMHEMVCRPVSCRPHLKHA